jgi:citrate lyase beta subunit
MTPEYIKKWESILEDVEKSRVPIQFIKKIVLKMVGKKQHTINVKNLLKQGLDPAEIEDVITRKMDELDPLITSIEFVLNVETIAETVQPETDRLLSKL